MISLIVAADLNNAIGYENKLLCQLKDDMANFVESTTNKTVIMGYKTFESLRCKPLKNRFNIVLTKNPMAMTVERMDAIGATSNIAYANFEFVQSMIKESKDKEFVVIGGEQIYELFLPLASRIYFTRIQHKFEQADTYFPSVDSKDWSIKHTASFPKNERNEYPFNSYILERKSIAMLGHCEECKEGLMIPMADITEVDYQDAVLTIHDHPYTICTHCNYIEYEDIFEAIEAAKSIYDEYGATSFEFMNSDGYQSISFDYPLDEEEVKVNPSDNKKLLSYAGAAGAAVVVLAGGLLLQKKRKRKTNSK